MRVVISRHGHETIHAGRRIVSSGGGTATGGNPVQRAIEQLIERLTSESGLVASAEAKHDACCTLARLLCDRGIAFMSFVRGAATLRAILEPAMVRDRLVELLRQQAFGWSSGRPDIPGHAALDRLLVHTDAVGCRWDTIEKQNLARRLDVDLSSLEKLFGGLGLSWCQFQRAVVVRPALPLLVHSGEYVSQIAYRLGYDHPSAFDRDFHLFLGVAPTMYRRLARIES